MWKKHMLVNKELFLVKSLLVEYQHSLELDLFQYLLVFYLYVCD